MAKRKSEPKPASPSPPSRQPSSLVDSRIIYCGDCLEQLRKLPDACADLVYIDPPFNSNRNHEVSWGETKETRAFEDRYDSRAAYIDYTRPRRVEQTRVLKRPASFCCRRGGHASNLPSTRSHGTGREQPE